MAGDENELRRLQETEQTWLAVCDALNEVAPGWLHQSGTARELACNTIRRLTAAPAPEDGRYTQADLNAEYTLGRKDGFDAASKPPLTYANQPGNVDAWRLGEACRAAAAEPKCGDPIDRGLILLRELQAKGYGVVSIAQAERQGESDAQ